METPPAEDGQPEGPAEPEAKGLKLWEMPKEESPLLCELDSKQWREAQDGDVILKRLKELMKSHREKALTQVELRAEQRGTEILCRYWYQLETTGYSPNRLFLQCVKR